MQNQDVSKDSVVDVEDHGVGRVIEAIPSTGRFSLYILCKSDTVTDRRHMLNVVTKTSEAPGRRIGSE